MNQTFYGYFYSLSFFYFYRKRGSFMSNSNYSFEQWCIDNDRNDILKRWDYDKNMCLPSDIGYMSNNKYFFKCPEGKHDRKYGTRNNTPEQLEEYINNRRKELNINKPFKMIDYLNGEILKPYK